MNNNTDSTPIIPCSLCGGTSGKCDPENTIKICDCADPCCRVNRPTQKLKFCRDWKDDGALENEELASRDLIAVNCHHAVTVKYVDPSREEKPKPNECTPRWLSQDLMYLHYDRLREIDNQDDKGFLPVSSFEPNTHFREPTLYCLELEDVKLKYSILGKYKHLLLEVMPIYVGLKSLSNGALLVLLISLRECLRRLCILGHESRTECALYVKVDTDLCQWETRVNGDIGGYSPVAGGEEEITIMYLTEFDSFNNSHTPASVEDLINSCTSHAVSNYFFGSSAISKLQEATFIKLIYEIRVLRKALALYRKAYISKQDANISDLISSIYMDSQSYPVNCFLYNMKKSEDMDAVIARVFPEDSPDRRFMSIDSCCFSMPLGKHPIDTVLVCGTTSAHCSVRTDYGHIINIVDPRFKRCKRAAPDYDDDDSVCTPPHKIKKFE